MNRDRPNQGYPGNNRVPPQEETYFQETTPISPSPSNSFPEDQNWQPGAGPTRGPPGQVKPSGPSNYRQPNQSAASGPTGPSNSNASSGARVNRMSGPMGPEHGMAPHANRTVSSNSSQGDENWNSTQSNFPVTKSDPNMSYNMNSPANQQSRPDSRGQFGSQPGQTGASGFKPDDLSPRPTPSPSLSGQSLSGPDRSSPMVQNQSRNNSADIMSNSPYSTGNNFPSGQPSPASQFDSNQFQNRNQKPGQINQPGQPNRGQISGQPGQNNSRMGQNDQKGGLSRAFPNAQPVNRQRNITPTSRPPSQMNQSPIMNRNQPVLGNQPAKRQPTAEQAWDQAMSASGGQSEPVQGSQSRFNSSGSTGNLPQGQMMNQPQQRNLNGPRPNHGMNQPQNQRMDQSQPGHQKRPSFGSSYDQPGIAGKPGQISPLSVNRPVRNMDGSISGTDQSQLGSIDPNLQSRPGMDHGSVIKTSSSQSYESNSEFLTNSHKPVGSVIQSGRQNRPPMSSVNTPSKVTPGLSGQAPRSGQKMNQAKHAGSISGLPEQNDPLVDIFDDDMGFLGSFNQPPVSTAVSKAVQPGMQSTPLTR